MFYNIWFLPTHAFSQLNDFGSTLLVKRVHVTRYDLIMHTGNTLNSDFFREIQLYFIQDYEHV